LNSLLSSLTGHSNIRRHNQRTAGSLQVFAFDPSLHGDCDLTYSIKLGGVKSDMVFVVGGSLQMVSFRLGTFSASYQFGEHQFPLNKLTVFF
jgi:hypothetical protein